MERLGVSKITHCHICSKALMPHPILYKSLKALCCRVHGYFFIEETDVIYRAFEPKKIKKVKKAKRPYTPALRGPNDKLRCDQTGVIYNTAKEITAILGVCKHAVSRHLHGRYRHVRGYTFTVLRHGETHEAFVPKARLRQGGGIPAIQLVCNETNEKFATRTDAAKALGLDASAISKHLNDRNIHPSVKGYSFTILSRGL